MTAKEYNETVSLWSGDVLRFVLRCGGSRADSEDVVQEALASLWSRRSEVEAGKGKQYLMGAAYRRLMHVLRHRRIEREHAASSQVLVSDSQAPDERFDLREAIEYSLRQLPEVQRAILQLRDVEGYSYQEIGDALALDSNRVQVYLFRARVAMRKQLIQMGYDEYKR